MKKKKFLIKLILAFAVIVLIYTVVATGVFFQKTNEFSHYRLLSSQKEYALQVRDKIDTQATVALNLVRQIKQSNRLIQFVREDKRDYYNLTKLHEEIKAMVNSFSNYGLKAGVGKVSDNLLVTSANTSLVSFFYDDMEWNDYQQQIIQDYIADQEMKDPLLVHNRSADGEAGKFLTIVKKEELTGGRNVIFYISFPTAALIPPLTEAEQKGFAIVAKNQLVSTSLSETEQSTQVLLSAQEELAEAPLGYTSVRKEDYTLHVTSSEILPQVKYVYMTRNNAASGQVQELLWDSMSIFMVLLASGGLIIWLIAVYTYRPYSRIVQANEALLEITEQSRLPMKQMFLRDILFGRLMENQIEAGVHANGLDSATMPATVVILEMKNDKDLSEQLSADGIRKATAQLRILIREHLADISHELLELDIMRFPIIVFGMNSKQLDPFIYELTSSIQAGPDMELIAVIGKDVASLGELHQSYQDALGLLEFRYTHLNEVVMTMDQLDKLVDADYYYPLDVERELITNIVRGKKEQAIAIIEKVLIENLEKRHLSNEVISQLLFSLTATANRVMQQLKWKSEDVFQEGYNIYTDLLSFESKEQLHTKVIELFKKMQEHYEGLEQPRDALLADQLFDYIHNHYHTDLSLQDIAEHFKLSVGYVGRMFKERTGENFKDYLNMHRVQTAKKLLDEKYIRMDELAKMVGCNNAITFTRMFKKYEGISPSQYGKRTENV